MFNFFKPKNRQPETLKPAQETAKPTTFDWRKSRAHVNLLSYFSEPREVTSTEKFQKWTEPLGEPVEVAIKRFVDLKLLEKADSAGHLFAAYSSTEIKRFLTGRHLPYSGTKEIMTKRLIEKDEQGIQPLIKDRFALICTQQGKKVAEAYKQYEIQRKKDSINLSEKYLLEGNYRQAALTVANYESKCVFKRGLNVSWDNYNPDHDEIMLRYIFTRTPKALIKHALDKTENGRIVAGMIHLWGNAKLAELTCTPDALDASQVLTSHAYYLYELDKCRNSDMKYVKIYNCNDSDVCPACRKVAKRKYKIDEVPEFPLANCTNEGGCRCWIGQTFS
jgi:hypothetical protein